MTSSYDQPQVPISTTLPKTFKHIPQTFTTNGTHDRALPTTQRPTMGGKTISAIRPTHHVPIMSSQDLLLLSRRIDPQALLTSSPHASPSKPPLPSLSLHHKHPKSKKRQPSTTVVVVPSDTTKKMNNNKDDVVQFVCEPCNKRYKTRNGYSYHVERCKSRRSIRQCEVKIQCICKDSELEKGTMIECNGCHRWLHTQCVGPILDESSYLCTKCCYSDQDKVIEAHDWMFMTEQDTQWEDEFITNVQDWADPPSLLFSDNVSLLDDFSSDIISSPLLPPSDWLHFANFEVDFQPEDIVL